MADAPQLVKIKIDGQELSVPKGMNIIEAAKTIGIDIPHYCYHQNLSIAGNCRMCQIEIKGQPKLNIACNSGAQEGMEVLTQNSSQAVKDAQAATLEFILINHPLDCTVCDQAGHCKLQDYHYEYNARPSRFVEEKVHKVKAEVLGPNVILDGERCIMCTRCIRFCDEVTKTSELGLLNRGDRSVIAVNEGKVLDNALSGTVVDLCPVGALTHRKWRFNTRIWYTSQTETICHGCSSGCNVKVAVRDGEIVHVKARNNQSVNKEWLCDEGRYGFARFLPESRVKAAQLNGRAVAVDDALKSAAKLKGAEVAIFISPDLLLEEYFLIKLLIQKHLKPAVVAVAHRERKLSAVESIIMSPDYSANLAGARWLGVVSGNIQSTYESALKSLSAGQYKHVIFFGDRSVWQQDINDGLLSGLSKAEASIGFFANQNSEITTAMKVLLPARSILEKSGLMINSKNRLQFSAAVTDAPDGTEADWLLINKLGEVFGAELTTAKSERDLTLQFLSQEARLADISTARIKSGGVSLDGGVQNMKQGEVEARV